MAVRALCQRWCYRLAGQQGGPRGNVGRSTAPPPVAGQRRVVRHCSSGNAADKPTPKPDSTLLKQFVDQIKMTGPITIHQYMRTVLTHPRGGYYMHKDVLGSEGDYITSPEISQMFGESIGVWVFNEWSKMGREKPLHLVELGPGRGTLMKDVLRVLHRLGESGETVRVHLVEISPYFREKQRATLCEESSPPAKDDHEIVTTTTKSPIKWYDRLEDVPEGFTIFLANEFFDALPIHQLVKKDGEWREVLLDITGDVGYGGYGAAGDQGTSCDGGQNSSAADDKSGQNSSAADDKSGTEKTSQEKAIDALDLPLRYILSRNQTPASVTYTKDLPEGRTQVEVCPDANVLMAQVAVRIKEKGGAMLMVDYGHSGTKGDTFRAFRQHRQQHPLLAPGTADLTADVDFSLLKAAMPAESVICYGPVSQSFFLKNMGIELRLLSLLRSCRNSEEQKSVMSRYKRIVEDLGSVFKVMAVYPAVMKKRLQKSPSPGFFRNLDGTWQDEEQANRETIKMDFPQNKNDTDKKE